MLSSPAGDGIFTSYQGADPAPIVKNVVSDGSKGNGFTVLGALELGPNISGSKNGGHGLDSPVMAQGVIHIIGGGPNAFDNNMFNGINLDGISVLNFEGGTTNGNAQGIRFGGNSAGMHTITGLTAKGNTGPGGVVSYGQQSIKMRMSTLVGNTNVGLFYTYTANNTLDIGTANDAGGNTFGGVSATNLNGKAGVRLCDGVGAPPLPSIPATGDTWSICPPKETTILCNAAIAAYSDVVYPPPAAAMNPVGAVGCKVGP